MVTLFSPLRLHEVALDPKTRDLPSIVLLASCAPLCLGESILRPCGNEAATEPLSHAHLPQTTGFFRDVHELGAPWRRRRRGQAKVEVGAKAEAKSGLCQNQVGTVSHSVPWKRRNADCIAIRTSGCALDTSCATGTSLPISAKARPYTATASHDGHQLRAADASHHSLRTTLSIAGARGHGS